MSEKDLTRASIWFFGITVIGLYILIFMVNCSTYCYLRYDMVGRDCRPALGAEVIGYDYASGNVVVNGKFVDAMSDVLDETVETVYMGHDTWLVDGRLLKKFYKAIEARR